MDLSNYSPLVLETWAAHEFFRRLGHQADHIYVEVLSDGVAVRVTDGKKLFRIAIGELEDLSQENFHLQWLSFIELWNNRRIKDEQAKGLWQKSAVLKSAVRTLIAMRSAGFPVRDQAHEVFVAKGEEQCR